jgi:hypothetical protein
MEKPLFRGPPDDKDPEECGANTTSNQEFQVFIVAEDNPTAEYSSEPKLLKEDDAE